MDNLGVSFAPTSTNAAMGPKNASLAGVPQAIQVISMALPRVLGARPVAPAPLLGSTGSGGDPNVQSALMQTILKTLGLPGGTAGPNQPPPSPVPNERGPELPYTRPSDPVLPQTPPPFNPIPRIVTQDGPFGGAAGSSPGARPSPDDRPPMGRRFTGRPNA